MRFVTAGLLAVVAALSIPGTAHAHVVATSARTYASDTNCVDNRSSISDGVGGGEWRGQVTSRFKGEMTFWSPNCFSYWSRPPGFLAVRYGLIKDMGAGRFSVCLHTPNWTHNTVKAATFALRFLAQSAFAPCGTGHYALFAGGYAANGDPSQLSNWYGGWLWSGWHELLGRPPGQVMALGERSGRQ